MKSRKGVIRPFPRGTHRHRLDPLHVIVERGGTAPLRTGGKSRGIEEHIVKATRPSLSEFRIAEGGEVRVVPKAGRIIEHTAGGLAAVAVMVVPVVAARRGDVLSEVETLVKSHGILVSVGRAGGTLQSREQNHVGGRTVIPIGGRLDVGTVGRVLEKAGGKTLKSRTRHRRRDGAVFVILEEGESGENDAGVADGVPVIRHGIIVVGIGFGVEVDSVLRTTLFDDVCHINGFFVKNSCHFVPFCGFVIKGVVGPVEGDRDRRGGVGAVEEVVRAPVLVGIEQAKALIDRLGVFFLSRNLIGKGEVAGEAAETRSSAEASADIAPLSVDGIILVPRLDVAEVVGLLVCGGRGDAVAALVVEGCDRFSARVLDIRQKRAV